MLDTLLNEETVRAILLALLLTVGVLTPLLIWRAKLNLEKEVRAFDCCKKKIVRLKGKIRSKEDDAYTVLMKDAGENPMNSSAAVQRYIYSVLNDKEEYELNSGYVSDRLYAILASVSTKNLVRKTPSLGDLHELTVQRERGGISTATFRVFAPGILVMGILGTLLGVHNKLPSISGEEGVSVLADTLIPGALAVFFTVLVMVLRGWYNKELSSFISEFDEYTLKILLTIFQSESQDDTDISQLNIALQEVKDSKRTMDKVLRGVNITHEMACESERLCAYLLLQTHENLAKMSAVFAASINNQENLTLLRNHIIGALSAYLNLCSSYKEQLENIQNLMNQAETVFCNLYENVGYPGMEFINGLHSWQSDLNQLRDIADVMGVSLHGINDSVGKLQKLVAFLDALPESVDLYKHHESVINSADDEIDTKIAEMAILEQQMREVYEELKIRFEQIQADCTAFFEEYQSEQQKVIETLRMHTSSILKMQHGVHSIYVRGWRGFKQRVKDRMMKLRSFYREPWGIVLVILMLVLLVVWNIWMQI